MRVNYVPDDTQLETAHVRRSCKKQNSTQIISTQGPLKKVLFTEDWSEIMPTDAEGPRSYKQVKAINYGPQAWRTRGRRVSRSKSWCCGRGAMGQEERGIFHHNVPVPGHVRSKKAKKKDQLPSSLLSPISALHWPEATKTSQPRESGQCTV